MNWVQLYLYDYANVRLGRKCLPATNALAYLRPPEGFISSKTEGRGGRYQTDKVIKNSKEKSILAFTRSLSDKEAYNRVIS